MDFQHAIDQVDDPIIPDAAARVETPLVVAVELETRVRHLEYQHRTPWVRITVVRAGSTNHRDIRFGLGVVIESYRHLGSHDEARRKQGPERVVNGPHRRRMAAPLRLGHDELPSDELDWMAGEHALTHQVFVFVS